MNQRSRSAAKYGEKKAIADAIQHQQLADSCEPKLTFVDDEQATTEAKLRRLAGPGALCWICPGFSTEEAVSIPPHDLELCLCGLLQAVAAAAELGHRGLDHLSLAEERMSLKLKGRRSTSRLPYLVGLILSRPLVTTATAPKELKVSPQAVESMLKELGSLRELTGRGRYRAWDIV